MKTALVPPATCVAPRRWVQQAEVQGTVCFGNWLYLLQNEVLYRQNLASARPFQAQPIDVGAKICYLLLLVSGTMIFSDATCSWMIEGGGQPVLCTAQWEPCVDYGYAWRHEGNTVYVWDGLRVRTITNTGLQPWSGLRVNSDFILLSTVRSDLLIGQSGIVPSGKSHQLAIDYSRPLHRFDPSDTATFHVGGGCFPAARLDKPGGRFGVYQMSGNRVVDSSTDAVLFNLQPCEDGYRLVGRYGRYLVLEQLFDIPPTTCLWIYELHR